MIQIEQNFVMVSVSFFHSRQVLCLFIFKYLHILYINNKYTAAVCLLFCYVCCCLSETWMQLWVGHQIAIFLELGRAWEIGTIRFIKMIKDKGRDISGRVWWSTISKTKLFDKWWIWWVNQSKKTKSRYDKFQIIEQYYHFVI